jgi:hypothetical protein
MKEAVMCGTHAFTRNMPYKTISEWTAGVRGAARLAIATQPAATTVTSISPV